MFNTVVTLFFLYVLLRVAYWAFVAIAAWMGRGKPLRHAVERGGLSEPTLAQVRTIERLRAEQKGEAGLGKLPRLTREQRREVLRAHIAYRDYFLDNLKLGFYQIFMIFFIASILGLIIEEIWMYLTAGLTESRVGLVWGPFSPIYGVGAALLTVFTFAMRRKNAPVWVVFVVSVVVGGSVEQFAGWAMETFFHAQSWDYSAVPGALTQWVALPFLFFWGVLGVVWYRSVMPELLYRLGVVTTRRQAIFIGVLAVYLAADIFMTIATFDRNAERHEGIAPQNMLDRWIDAHYNDGFIEQRFQNLTIEE